VNQVNQLNQVHQVNQANQENQVIEANQENQTKLLLFLSQITFLYICEPYIGTLVCKVIWQLKFKGTHPQSFKQDVFLKCHCLVLRKRFSRVYSHYKSLQFLALPYQSTILSFPMLSLNGGGVKAYTIWNGHSCNKDSL